MYFLKSISDSGEFAKSVFRQYSKTKRLVLGSFLACMAAILQSAGGFMPGVGYLISPFATLPILICSIFSLPIGLISYFLAILLLTIIQPSELIVFPFTTGLLGISIGAGFSFLKKRLSIITVGAICLSLGIMVLLIGFRFPVLGPMATDSLSLLTIGSIFFFGFLYSWLWVQVALFFLKRLKAAIS